MTAHPNRSFDVEEANFDELVVAHLNKLQMLPHIGTAWKSK